MKIRGKLIETVGVKLLGLLAGLHRSRSSLTFADLATRSFTVLKLSKTAS